MLHKMVSFLLFCAIFLMVGCADVPRTINNLNLDHPDAPLHITVFQIDRLRAIDGTKACIKNGSVWFAEGRFFRPYLVRYSVGTDIKVTSVPLKDGFVFCAVTSNSIWVTGGNPLFGFSLTQIDIATNRVVKVVPLEGGVGVLTASHDTLWILIQRTGNLYRITENETHLVFISKLKETYRSIAFAADSIWAYHQRECRVDRIDPNSGKVLAEISPLFDPGVRISDYGFGNGSLSYGEGSLWLNCDRLDKPYGAILRIDPNRNEVIANIQVDWKPQSPVFAMGFAWVSTYGSNRGDYHWLEKIDVRTNKVVDKYRLGGGGEQPFLVPATDALWAIGDGVAWQIKVK